MIYEAKVIADSIADNNVRVTTLQLTYPRFFHSEMMTHRVFSRNATSSRAIPVAKFIQSIRETPAMPSYWGRNKPGMQAEEELGPEDIEKAELLWREAANLMADYARKFADLGVHKQIANRILEPWQHMSVVLTSTEWDNFFNLRYHGDAQPEFKKLAGMMRKALNTSEPVFLEEEQWHMPYIKEEERSLYSVNDLLKMSAARCARVSYNNHDGTNPSFEKDMETFSKLVNSDRIHASPLEHQATPMPDTKFYKNFRGWKQFRSLVEEGQY